ncbi:hypothetical protein EMO89_01580 [Bifidobacterium tissieri]|uniref:Uncharacterized protein n=1 Tax=Bifidobacterium tissieri TaxID=1630162 RepID=A0A5M9ZVZ1_9BIFI|nr:hypothetical protein [Bifidobacterium tissieri]KAA8831453.1 hypothetical protein EMO89_01580 [Bifidobacterium tissieri]
MIVLLTLLIIIIALIAIAIPVRFLGRRMLEDLPIKWRDNPADRLFAYMTATVIVICTYLLIGVGIFVAYLLAHWILTTVVG